MLKSLFFSAILIFWSSGEASALDGAEQAAAPGVVHINVAEPWRSEEAAFEVLFLQDTHTSRGFLDNFSLGSFPVCRRISRRSLSYSFTHFQSQFPRVSWDVDRQRLDIRKDRCCRGLQAQGLGGRQRCFFFQEAQRWQAASCRSKTQRRTRHLTRHLTLQGTLNRHRQHLPSSKWAHLDPQIGPGPHFGFPKISKWALGLIFFWSVRKWWKPGSKNDGHPL